MQFGCEREKLMNNWLRVLCLALGAAAAVPAGATVITYTLDDEFSGGAIPAGTYTASFDDTACGVDCVELTLTATGPSSEFVTEWDFNYAFDPDLLTITHISGVVGTVDTETDDFKADGGNLFDISFDFPSGPPSARLSGGTSSVYTFSGVVGLTAADFDILAAPTSGNGGGGHTAAHVQGIATPPGSGWVSDLPPSPLPIPEPNVVWLFGAALLGLAWAQRRNAKRP